MRFERFIFGQTFSRDSAVAYLADHLDDALELIDRIAALELGPNQQTITDDVEHDGEWIMGGDAIVSRFAEIRAYVHELKKLELGLTTKISQARIWAERVQRYDPRLERVASLMLSGTHAFVDAGARQADTTEDDFNVSDPALGYLRARALISDDVVSMDQVGAISTGYMLQLWGGIPLIDLAEMINSFLAAADVHYSLYEADDTAPVDAEVEDSTSATVEEIDEVSDVETGDPVDIALEEDSTPEVEHLAEDATSPSEDSSPTLAKPVHVMGAIESDESAEEKPA